ncbi:tRNA pseudouridine(38-40) synthase TruA [Sphingobacterium gobiense]|uniref:tRNA pseudouridine synthase A n=1 Tax=Sphingobacterium gobiense TaxID=1382456 RepID=A0A2S9JL66_9SPHI|nr:tRNA pseudouridine(38-40) synthase TruA [Sphingobacterium gobiense]PRD53897.1 tRNA pseudouridine(38-40) synthase TruA [Sphingobacterium gobiense]
MEDSLQRFFLEIAYDGTAYHGWQVQENAISVQQRLNEALHKILRYPIETVGAGRTDTGVHAKQLFVHLDIPVGRTKNEDRFLHSLNALLPHDIAVYRILPVEQDAHARFDATERAYEYHVHFCKNPFLLNKSWQLRDAPDVALMNQAAAFLVGTQDFECFSKSHTQVYTNICTVTQAYWQETNGGLVFHITANRFLRNMVRAIVGTLLDIGLKKKTPEFILDVIGSKDRSKAGTSVPAHGLYLTKIVYPYIDTTF